jgi:hypothetical protein
MKILVLWNKESAGDAYGTQGNEESPGTRERLVLIYFFYPHLGFLQADAVFPCPTYGLGRISKRSVSQSVRKGENIRAQPYGLRSVLLFEVRFDTVGAAFCAAG